MIMEGYCGGKVHNMLPRLYYDNWGSNMKRGHNV